MDIEFKFKDFTYDSALDESDDVKKYMHYVFWRQEFVGMLPLSPYELPNEQQFKEWCNEFLLKKDVARW